MQLRNLRIYKMPNGREYIADLLNREGAHLHPVNAWGNYSFAEFVVKRDGRIIRDSKPTPWSVEQLKDTGRDAQYPRATLL
jgi:hypothetical protein